MEMSELLKSINSFNEYILTSQDASNKFKESKVHFNMSTVLALKKFRSYEIEYFNKCEENGLACTLLEHLLKLPPSKTWAMLGKELVNLLQYWLEAIRKHLISHSIHWWTFLKKLLEFVKQINQKDTCLPNLLVEHTAECLLDLVVNDLADPFQKLEILHCLNLCSVESSREIRFAMRKKFSDYFVKLSSFMLSCGYLPCQWVALETLMRWLVPRQDAELRAAAARRWLPRAACPPLAADLFLTRTWIDFNKDARDFLCAVNEPGDLITSVICRKLMIGAVVVISGTERQETWVDINSTGRCVSVMLRAGALRAGGGALPADTLLLAADSAQAVSLYREHARLTISVSTSTPLQAQPAAFKLADSANGLFKITVSSTSNVTRLDKALRNVFGDKYQLLMDLDNLSLSQLASSESLKRNNCSSSEEETRFSHPAQVKRRKCSGYNVRSKRSAWNSPSTASTSSLALLRDKLAALPRYDYFKEPTSVCVRPELSSVTEVSETDDKSSLKSAITSKFNHYGVSYRDIKIKDKYKRNCQSEGQVKRTQKVIKLSPTDSGENSVRSLLVTNLGSDKESVISDAIEHLSKAKNSDHIVDLLVQEALHNIEVDQRDKLLDSGINSGNINKNQTIHDENSETIENTPFADKTKTVPRKSVTDKKNCTVISKSTSTDESNVEDSPVNYVNVRERRKKNLGLRKVLSIEHLKHTVIEKQTIDVRDVEFFNQNLSENSVEDEVVCPTLAKKINELSSETSETFDDENFTFFNENNILIPVKDFDDVEIIECLNSMVDKISDEIEKCTDNLNRENNDILKMAEIKEDGIHKAPSNSEVKENFDVSKTTFKQKNPKQKNEIKLKFKSTIKRKNAVKLDSKIQKNKKIITENDSIPGADIVHSSALETGQIRKTRITKKGRDKNTKPISKMSVILETDNAIIDDMIQKENYLQNKPMVVTPEAKRDTNDTCNKTELETPLMKKKRKLYSPKEEQTNEQPDMQISGTEEHDTTVSELKSTEIKTPKSVATCYKELENERRRYIRKPRTSKSRSKVPDPISPRTLKMNKVFEKLKENIENNENIRIANRTSTGMDVYNFTSDSEDEDFKKKKINIQKKTSITTLHSFKSPISTTHGRFINRVNYNDNESSIDEKKSANVKRKRVVKKHKINRKAGTKPINLVDEQMRQMTSEGLNTSLVLEKSIAITNNEPELVLEKAPELEHIANNHLETDKNVEMKIKTDKKVKTHKKEKVTIKKNTVNVDITEDRTESPLPGLVIESIPTHPIDPNDSVTKNMLQKFKKIYEGSEACINETNTTQNLLSDAEKVVYSPDNRRSTCHIEDIAQIEIVDLTKKNEKTTKLRKSRMKLKRNTSNIEGTNLSHSKMEVISNNIDEIIHIYKPQDEMCEKSIQTIDITAHGNIDEVPPSPEMIEENVQPRDLDLEDLSQSMRDYFSELTAKLNEINRKTSSSNKCNSCNIAKIRSKSSSDNKTSPLMIISNFTPEEVANFSSANKDISHNSTDKNKEKKVNVSPDEIKSPVVSVTRLSSNSMHKYLPSRNNSSSDQNSEKSYIYENNIKKHDMTNRLKSPVVSVKRLSLSEIHKWLPSQNNSISDQNSEKSNTFKNKTNKNNSTNKKKSPVVSVKRLNLSKIHKRIPSQNNSISVSNLEKSNVSQINIKKHRTTNKDLETSPVVSVKRLSSSEVHQWLLSRRKSSSDREYQEIRESVVERHIRTNKCNNSMNDSVKLNKSLIQRTSKPAFDEENRYTEISSHKVDNEWRVNSKLISGKSVGDEENNRKSLIFLIEIDGLYSNCEKIREASHSNDNDKYVSENIMTKANATRPQGVNSSPEKQPLKRHSNNSRSGDDTDIDSPVSTSTKIDSSRVGMKMKRKSSNLRDVKKQKTEDISNSETAIVAEGGPSISSVNDWFNRNELATGKDDTIRLTLVDLIQNVTDKLDTSLDEMNKNTSRKLVNLFVDTQKQLDKQKQERQALFRQTSSDIMMMIEKKIADFEKRSQEMEADFMEQLRNRASEMILKDAQQKQVLVQIMREDVQAVVDHINKNKK